MFSMKKYNEAKKEVESGELFNRFSMGVLFLVFSISSTSIIWGRVVYESWYFPLSILYGLSGSCWRLRWNKQLVLGYWMVFPFGCIQLYVRLAWRLVFVRIIQVWIS